MQICLMRDRCQIKSHQLSRRNGMLVITGRPSPDDQQHLKSKAIAPSVNPPALKIMHASATVNSRGGGAVAGNYADEVRRTESRCH